MKRRLSAREVALLIVLLVLVAASAYYLWFYVPMQEKQTALEGQILDTRNEIEIDKVRVVKMEQMEEELRQIFADDPDPVSMAAYDNSQRVMFELHSILSETDDYSLNFSSVNTGADDNIVRRNISMNFETDDYEAAKSVLQKLHDSDYRCMMDDLSIRAEEHTETYNSLLGLDELFSDDTERGTPAVRTVTSIKVSASIVFFEYL